MKHLIKLLKLTRPLVAFDLETMLHDGVSYIVQVGASKIHPDGVVETINDYIKPPYPIDALTRAVHGITDDDVKDSPTFADKVQEYLAYFGDADLAGYNSVYFDYPVLCEEFARHHARYPILPDLQQYDALSMFRKQRPSRLANAYLHYTGKVLEDAHDAHADITATLEIIAAQALQERVDPSDESLDGSLGAVSTYIKRGCLDWSGKIKMIDGTACYNFGKNEGTAVAADTGYARWMLGTDFPEETKQILRELLGL